MQNLEPKPSSAPGNYRQVLNLLPQPSSIGKVLDCPCGTGALTKKLHERGFQVVTGDFSPEIFQWSASHSPVYTDLNGTLPFSDRTFDAGICCDGLGDVENIDNAVREFARVLVPGAAFVVSLPNILSLRSRLRFLLTGFYNKFKGPLDEVNGAATRRPIPFWELRYVLHRHGFRIKNIRHNRIKAADLLVSPLIPVIWLAALILRFLIKDRVGSDQKSRSEVLRQLLHPSLLLGESLIVLARRENGSMG